MQAAVAALKREWAAEGLPEIRIGVGVNTGPMAIGDMGSEQRFDCTVVVDAVNVAARPVSASSR